MNTRSIITKIRNLIENGTSLKAYSPDLPQDGDNICAVTQLGGTGLLNLCGNREYWTLTIRILLRGTANDTTTRELADNIINLLDNQKDIDLDIGKIIYIWATTTPIYVGRDENNRIIYNITFNVNVE